MKNKNISVSQIVTAAVAVLLAIILAGLLVKGAAPAQVAAVPVVPANFPDVSNNSRFSNFLNSAALDPTQAVPIGNSQNNSPFNKGP